MERPGWAQLFSAHPVKACPRVELRRPPRKFLCTMLENPATGFAGVDGHFLYTKKTAPFSYTPAKSPPARNPVVAQTCPDTFFAIPALM